jgi:O-antigen/teichoic acid export membrane protein
LKSRLLKGTGAQAFGQAVQILIRLTEVPLLLAFWGPQLYGEWLMLAAIPAYLSIGDGGFATTACRDMTMKSGAGDGDGVIRVFQSTWVLLLLVSAATALLALVFVKTAPLSHWLGFKTMTEGQTQVVLLLLVTHVLVGFQGGLLNGGFWVAGRYPLGMTFGALTNLLEFSGLAAAVALGGGPVQAAAGYLVGRCLGTGLTFAGHRRVTPWLRHGLSRASLKELRRLAAPAFASLAFPLGNALNIQGMRLVVGLALGPSAVAVFVPLRTLSRLVIQPRGVVNRVMEPEMAVAYGAKDRALFQKLFFKSCQMTFWATLTACAALIPATFWIYPTWTAGKLTMNWTVYLLLIAGCLLNGVWYTALMVPYATNRHVKIAAYYTAIYGGAAICLGYFWTKWMGLTGAALALAAAEGAMAVVVVRKALLLTQTIHTEWMQTVFVPPRDVFVQAASILRNPRSSIS